MIRKLLWILVALGIFAFVERLFRKPSARVPRGASTALRFEGAMVRDRVCGTFLPRPQALSLRAEDGEHFFCSAACRDAFLARSRDRRSA